MTIVFCVVIAVVGIGVLGSLMGQSNQLKQIKEKADKAYRSTREYKRAIAQEHRIEISYKESIDITKMDEPIEEFNQVCAKNATSVQLISVFPLLGLLGTVSGLIPGLKSLAEQNLEPLYNSLSLALWTTFAGILVSIILKVVVALTTSKQITELENLFDDNERQFNNMVTYQKYKED